MATKSQVDQGQVDLNINQQVFDDVRKLESSLQGVLKVLNSVSSGFKGMSIPGVSSTSTSNANLGSQIAVLTRDVRSLLAAAKQSGAISQTGVPAAYSSAVNQGRVQGASQAARFSNNRVELELANAQVKAAERRFEILKSQDVLEEAQRRRTVTSIGMQTQARKELANMDKAQAEYSKALLANDEQAARLAKQELVSGRQRLDQLETELKLRQAGARVRLANAMDGGTRAQVNTADLQLKAVNESMAQMRAAQREQDRMMRASEQAAEAQRRQNTARAARESAQAERYAASYGPTNQTRQQAQDREAARAQSDAYRPARLAATQTQLLANYTATRAVMDSMRAGIQFTLQYEEELMHLRTITKATDDQMRGLQSTIEAVSNTTRYSADDLTNAAAALSETGVTINQMGGSLKAVSDLATATGAGFTMAVNTVTGSLGAFKMSANDTVDVANMIAQAVNSSRLTMDKLKTSIETAGETASQAGVSFKEFLAAAATIADSGTGTGQTLGNGMRQLLLDLENPSKGLKDALSRLGLVEEDINVKTQGLYGALMNLKTAGFTASDAMNVFEARSSSAFNALTSNLQKMESFQESLLNTDAATRANADQMETLGAQYDRVRNQTNLLVSEGLKPMAAVLTNVFEAVANGEGKLKEFSAVVQAIGALLTGGAFAVGLSWAAKLMGGLAALTFTSGGVAARMLSAATWAAAAGPIGLYVGAVAAAAGGLAYLISQLTKTEDAFEKQRTKVNESKAALQESTQAYDTIGRRISNVQDKMIAMNRDTSGAMLRREVNDVAKQFEEYGVTLDRSAIKKTEDLIDALQRLRNELGKRYSIDASILANDMETLAIRAGDKAGEVSRGVKGRPFMSGNVDRALALPGLYSGYSNFDFFTGAASRNGRRLGTTLTGAQSSGFLPIEEQLSTANVAQIVQYLRDSGVNGAAGAGAGLLEAFGLNGKKAPNDVNSIGQSISAFSDLRRMATLQRSQSSEGSADYRRAEAVIQLAENMNASLTKVQQAVLEQEKATRDADQARKTEASAQYRQSPEAQAMAKEVSDVVKTVNTAMASRASSPTQSFEALWNAVKQAESGGRQFGSDGKPLTSSKGAVGVSQMLETTGPEAARLAGVEWNKESFYNDSNYNEKLGRAYLQSLLSRYSGNQMLATSAYNWGMGNVDQLIGKGDPRVPGSGVTSTDFMMKLPAETRNYNQSVGTADYASGLGVYGAYNQLMANKDMAAARTLAGNKLRELTTALEAATKSGNDSVVDSLNEQIKAVNEAKSGIDKVYAGSRAAAEQAIGRTSQARQRSYADQIEAERRQLADEKDPEVVKAAFERIKALTNMTYETRIQALKDTNEAKFNPATGTTEYTQDINDQLLSLQQQWEAEIAKETANQKHEMENRYKIIGDNQLSTRMKTENVDFKNLIQRLEASRKGINKNLASDLNDAEINSGLRGFQRDQQLMSDPRYASRYSAAQREYMSRSMADAQDVTNKAQYEAVTARLREMDANVKTLQNLIGTFDKTVGSDQDGPLYAQRDQYGENTKEYQRLTKEIDAANSQRQTATEKLNSLETDRVAILQQQKDLYEKISQVPPRPANFTEGVDMVNKNFLNKNDPTEQAIAGYGSMIDTSKNSLATFLSDIATRSKTAGDAFKDFGRSVAKSLLDIATQYLAMGAIRGLLSLVGSVAGAAGGAAGASAGAGDVMTPTTTGFANMGGMARAGSIHRFAGGGMVPGGLARDSVHALLRPGEMVMNTEAVSAVGAGYLADLNTAGRREIQDSAPPRMPSQQREADMTNVYVVAPDHQPTMGPKDVLVTIQDDILRNGFTKKLIKQVAMGQT
ncbi:putative lysin [Achromobacter phage JWF]|uniref:tail length tape measure protein n=1 Tax=Achromobacter phage JWF TaxID=1589748 RepID=UPI000588E0BD|nr:tail length tape measure protein [Achromobacter phage JWF]AJD82914.1 putative lysin [Achromobacter phage JWF]